MSVQSQTQLLRVPQAVYVRLEFPIFCKGFFITSFRFHSWGRNFRNLWKENLILYSNKWGNTWCKISVVYESIKTSRNQHFLLLRLFSNPSCFLTHFWILFCSETHKTDRCCSYSETISSNGFPFFGQGIEGLSENTAKVNVFNRIS